MRAAMLAGLTWRALEVPMRSRVLLLAILSLACDAPEAPTATELAPVPVADAAAKVERTREPARPDLLVPPPKLPRGLVHNGPGASPGYVLFNPTLSDTAYLIDNAGQVVHVWKTPYGPGGDLELLPSGNLLRGARDPAALGFAAGGTGGILQELAWDGSVVWEWRLSDAQRIHHHDVTALPNGNVLLLAWEVKTPEAARHAGRRADQIPEQGLWPDFVLEVEPQRPAGARVVWEWHVWDHLIQHHDAAAESYGDPAQHPGRIDANAGTHAPPIDAAQLEQLKALGYVSPQATPQDLRSDFLHINTVAYHPRLDQIALSVPTLGEVWIVDHSTSTAEARGSTGGRSGRGGDLLYRWGNPAVYGRGGESDQRLFFQHDVRWIPDGWDGAGNLLVFNNGRGRPEGAWSSVDEWTPPLGADGLYALSGGAAFGPAALAWRYRAPEPTELYAPFVSGAQRLANGNTLVCAGTDGSFFEVTRAGEVVWSYRNPYSGAVRNVDGSLPQPRADERPFALFRATRIPPDHPALAGRTLAPLDPQPAPFDYRPKSP
jgi:hypothetical protein